MQSPGATYIGNIGRQADDGGRPAGAFGARLAHLAAWLRLSGKDYTQVRQVPLAPGGGVNVDRVVVSPFGVFVVDTQHMRGRIYGGAEQKAWVCQAGRHKHAFANPLVRVNRQARMLAAMAGLDAGKVFPVLAFAGGTSFDASVPENVTTVGGYARYIKSNTVQILTKSDVARVVQRLEARIDHERHGGDAEAARACPSCGRDMVLRNAKKGDEAGKRFWVCSDFPTCRSAIEAEPAAVRAAPKPAPEDVRARAQTPTRAPAQQSADAEFSRPNLF